MMTLLQTTIIMTVYISAIILILDRQRVNEPVPNKQPPLFSLIRAEKSLLEANNISSINEKRNKMKKIIFVLIISIGIYGYVQNNPAIISSFTEQNVPTNKEIEDAYQNQLSGIQVSGSGVVIRTLGDDNEGRRHQRFILRISSGQTILIAHNIDLAPKINKLQKGDIVEFYGEYEWNPKGGVVHWTHHDPGGRHAAGWLKHNGRKYE